jgi:hypothetical protein
MFYPSQKFISIGRLKTELFQTPLRPSLQNPFRHRYAVSNDGQRFLIASGSNTPVTNGDSIPITAVVNWTATLRQEVVSGGFSARH